MLQNYFTLAWRNLLKNKISSFINIGGLAIGMAVAMLIGLWIYDEISFDTFYKNYHQIAKLRQHITVNGIVQTEKTIPFPLAAELRNHYGRYFKYVVLSSHRRVHILSYEEKNLSQNGVYLEPAAIDMLSLNMLSGNKAALQDPDGLVLSASAAKAFFGDGDPMNKIIRIDSVNAKVTGVYADLPANSTFASVKFIAAFDQYVQNDSWIQGLRNNWSVSPVQAYVQLAEGVSMETVSAVIRNVKRNRLGKEDPAFSAVIFADPMSTWHLDADFKNGVRSGGKRQYLWMFAVIGIFVLLLACINFMNLSTARSEKRAREVGIRKTMGSGRPQLIAQFFSESLLVAVFAWLCCVCLVALSLPFFNAVAGKKIVVAWNAPLFWFSGLGFSIVTGFIAGSYPAFYLSSFKPVKVLKGTFRAGKFAAVPRKALVVMQFTVSVALIICTAIVFQQIRYTQNRAVGYNRYNLLVAPLQTRAVQRTAGLLQQAILETGAVVAAATSESPTTDIWGTDNSLSWKGKDPALKVDFPNTAVSLDYGKTIGWEVVQGRDFSKQLLSDSSAFVINEAAAKYMQLSHPVGEIISSHGQPYTVIGVIKNVVTESPYETVRPSVYAVSRGAANYLFLRINTAYGGARAIQTIEKLFKQYNPAIPFDYSYVDEDFAAKLGNEERVAKLSSLFAVLAILISCLGLYGLASFVAEQRTKEIGVRKVLGASVFDVWQLLSGEFTLLVVIALLIAAPLAWYFMQQWLQHYPYRATISWWVFAATGAAALLLTFFTVSTQAIKAALMNPIKSLRTE